MIWTGIVDKSYRIIDPEHLPHLLNMTNETTPYLTPLVLLYIPSFLCRSVLKIENRHMSLFTRFFTL